ncbi:hypothetical protein [Neptunicella sp. SCSIO 80796]|uniref:hypothetical protein n=1 Tax=Neptunicella plasticusilytica TaxID=3117012 RepID=UPI003A4DFA77
MRWIIMLQLLYVTGCTGIGMDQTAESEDEIDWHSPQAEAQRAIQRGDVGLWIEARRGVAVLGLEDIAPVQIEERCGLKYLPDSGDVYRPEERELRKQKRQFGLEYNRLVIPYCVKKLQL